MAELCRQATSVDLFVQTHMQIWHKSAKHGLGKKKKSLFPEWQKSSADKTSPVTRLATTCCRDSSFISRVLWILMCTIHDLLQHHLFQCGCHCITAMQAAVQQQLCRAPAEPAEPCYSRQDPKKTILVSASYQSKCKENSKKTDSFEIESIQKNTMLWLKEVRSPSFPEQWEY